MTTIVIFSLMLLFASQANAGFDSGNAGDTYSAEFLFSGRDVLQRLELLAANGQSPSGPPRGPSSGPTNEPTNEPEIDIKKLRASMEATSVVSEERVYLDGLERDAVNFPAKKLIKVSRKRWSELRQSSETKARLTLVLHEFLWISGIDDTNFSHSSKIIQRLNVPPYSPSIWLNLPGRAFAFAECAGMAPDGSIVTVIISTKGVTKAPDHGEVRILSKGHNFGYRFKSDEISQFFEYDDVETNSASVGLGAYIHREFPVAVKYEGPNYVDMDLAAVLETGGHSPAGTQNMRNFMRVWKGPGYEAAEQYKIVNPVCSVDSNN